MSLARTRTTAGVIAVGLCLAYLVFGAAVPPSLMPDPSYGFAVLKSAEKGAAWNHLIEPDEENIASDRSYFYATWSPGQYMVPGLLVKSFGASIGTAAKIVAMFCALTGLAGWLALWLTLGFDWSVALVSVALIAASRSFNFSFLNYNGGEVLAFAAFPWIAAGIFRMRTSFWLAPMAFAGMVAGFFAKNSMLIYLSAWIGGVVAVVIWEEGRQRSAQVRVTATLAATAAAIGFLYVAYVARGWTALAANVFGTERFSTFVPLAMPVLAGTGWDDVVSWLFTHPSQATPVFEYRQAPLFLVAVVIAAALWMWPVLSQPERRPATIQAALYVALSLVVFFYLFVSNSSANAELSRHYRLLGYVLLPFIVARFDRPGLPAFKAAAVALLIVPCAYGILSFGSNWQRHYQRRDSHSARVKVAHLQLTPRTVTFLTALDAGLPAGSLVVTPTPVYALEFDRTRVMATSAVTESAAELEAGLKKGRVGNLVVMAETTAMPSAEIEAWLRSFASYANARWDHLDLDDQRFYVPSDQEVDRAWLAARVK